MSSKHECEWLEREDFDEVTVMRLNTPMVLNEEGIRSVFDSIYDLVGAGRNRVVLSLSVVDHLPSMAVGKIVKLNKMVQDDDGRLALCHLSPIVEDIIEAASMTALFDVYATEQEALESFSCG